VKKDEEFKRVYESLKPLAKEYDLSEKEIERLIVNLSHQSTINAQDIIGELIKQNTK
jgi:hypothetical protein